MMNTEKLEKILKKKKDKIPVLLEVFRLTGNLCNIPEDVFDANFNLSLDKVENLSFLADQSKKTTGYVLNENDYRSVGIFESHIKKLRQKSKKSPKRDKLLKLMPELCRLIKEKNLSLAEIQSYLKKERKLSVSKGYICKVFNGINKKF